MKQFRCMRMLTDRGQTAFRVDSETGEREITFTTMWPEEKYQANSPNLSWLPLRGWMARMYDAEYIAQTTEPEPMFVFDEESQA